MTKKKDQTLFVPVTFAQAQELMNHHHFNANAILITGEMEREYGPSSYLVRLSWLEAQSERGKEAANE